MPNVLLIMVDDMGYGDVAHSGNPYIRTPFLDSLAQQSVQFQNFYVSPVCAPTRASLLTGRYHQRTGVRSVTNGYEIMDPGEYTLAEMLRDAGYRTALFGKWHLGEYYPSLPNAQGFDEYLGFRTGHTAHYFDPVLEHNGRPEAYQGHITEVLTDQALAFMLEKEASPFFCYLAYNAPHTPLQIDSGWIQPYLDKGLEEREARVYGLVEQLDHELGRLLARLEQASLSENTVLVFLSDNGPISGWRIAQEAMRYNAGLRDQKFTVYEGGIRTQCYWRWGGHFAEGKTIETVAGHIDVVPTLAQLLGLTLPDSLRVDGISLLPLLLETTDTLASRTFFQKYALETLADPAPFPGGMARQGDWKMVDGVELYNLKEDPRERQNLGREHPGLLRDLTERYLAWYRALMADHRMANTAIEVGHPRENPIFLQPHHGTASGGLQFTGRRGLLGERIGVHPSGVDGDWLANWQGPDDRIGWNVRVVAAGNYRIGLRVRGQRLPEGIPLRLEVGAEQLTATLPTDQLDNQWQDIHLGTLALTGGGQTIALSLPHRLADNDLAIRSLILERVVR